MQRSLSIFLGACLIAFGLLVMGTNLGLPMLGVHVHWWEAWRFWPMVILGLGAFLTGLPLLFPRHRGMGLLFISGCLAAFERNLDILFSPEADGNLAIAPYSAVAGLLEFLSNLRG